MRKPGRGSFAAALDGPRSLTLPTPVFCAVVQRLQTRPQFQAVLAGAVVAKTVHFVLHRNALDARVPPAPDSKKTRDISSPAGDTHVPPASLFPHDCTWIGAMVPKRWAKRAVTRNTIKRQIYTLSAGFEDQYPAAAFVVRLRREFSRQQFVSATSAPLKEAVRHEVLALLQAGLQTSRPPAKAPTA